MRGCLSHWDWRLPWAASAGPSSAGTIGRVGSWWWPMAGTLCLLHGVPWRGLSPSARPTLLNGVLSADCGGWGLGRRVRGGGCADDFFRVLRTAHGLADLRAFVFGGMRPRPQLRQPQGVALDGVPPPARVDRGG